MKYIYQLQLKNRKAAVIALNVEDAWRILNIVDPTCDWSDASVSRLTPAHNHAVCRVLAITEAL